MTNVISAAELAAMRAVADDYFPDLCTIQTPTQGVDSTGSPIETFADTYSNVACRLDPTGAGNETVMNLALQGQSTWWLNIAYDQLIDETYRVVHGGVLYHVKSVWAAQSYATIRRALLVRVNFDAS